MYRAPDASVETTAPDADVETTHSSTKRQNSARHREARQGEASAVPTTAGQACQAGHRSARQRARVFALRACAEKRGGSISAPRRRRTRGAPGVCNQRQSHRRLWANFNFSANAPYPANRLSRSYSLVRHAFKIIPREYPDSQRWTGGHESWQEYYPCKGIWVSAPKRRVINH